MLARQALARRGHCSKTPRSRFDWGIFIHLVGLPNQRRLLAMLAIRITCNQLRAGRDLADLSMEDLATRARLLRRTLSKWEGSSGTAVDAMVAHLSRARDVLEAEGVVFVDGGVHLQRPAPISATMHSGASA
jgi:hypothetical protein